MKLKSTLVPGATILAAATMVSLGVAAQGQGGNASVGGPSIAPPATTVTPSKAQGGVAHSLVGISPQGLNTTAYSISTATGVATNLGNVGVDHGSGLSRQPGTRDFYIGGGMQDGGNIYLGALGTSVLIGPSGFGAIPGLAWDPAGTHLYGTTTVAVLADGLVEINPLTGGATVVGNMGIGGIDAIAFNPTTGTLYGSTGFFYDGNPGDVITINPATGQATDTFQDMTPIPPCTVAGMAFDPQGTGYVSIGCFGGQVYEWNLATNGLTLLSTGSSGFSMSDIELLR